MKKSKKTGSPESSAASPGKLTASWEIRVTDRLARQIRNLPENKQQSVGACLCEVQAAWGIPHLHSGTGIRKLGRDLFECRVGLDTRLLFVADTRNSELAFFALGNHDEIRRLLKRL